MDIFDKIKPKNETENITPNEEVIGIYVKKGDTYYCSKPKGIDYFSEGQVEFAPKPKSTFASRKLAKSFYRKTIFYFDSSLDNYIDQQIDNGKEFDFSCLSMEKQRKLLIFAAESIKGAWFLHKKGFDFDTVIKNSVFASDLAEISYYSYIIPYIKDKNICDANGIPLLVGVTNADDFLQVLRYKANTDFVVNGKNLKQYIMERNISEIIELAFSCGLIGVTRDEVMGLSGINTPGKRYCPFLDMLKKEIIDIEKNEKPEPQKVTTKKELSAKAEIDALFENAQTTVK